MNNQKKIIRVLMLGASLNSNGGIVSVENLILNHTIPELKIYHIPTFSKGSTTLNTIVFIKAIKSLIWNLLTGRSDMVHIHFAERGSTIRKTILISILLIFRHPFILHAHGATFKEFYENLPRIIKFIVMNLFSKCAKFISLSYKWKDYYSKIFNLNDKNIKVLYNPVQLPSSIPQRQENRYLKFVFLGIIGQRGGTLDIAKSIVTLPKQNKGSFDLIRAFAALPESDKNCAELVLAGNGDLESAQQLIQELGIEKKVTILSWLSSEKRDQLLATADVFVLPSYNEGLPMSMLEAMAWSLPVIVTPVGGIPEVINHNQNGLLVQPGNQEQLVQAMQNLIRDEELRISLATAARKSVEYFDIKNYMALLLELYTSVISDET